MSESSSNPSIIRLPELNLPRYEARLRRDVAAPDAVEIYDVLRAKWVALTPEEWVRQSFVNMLMTCRGYSAQLMANEVGIILNGTRRRCDTLVYDRAMKVALIVEYKAPTVVITQRVFDQIARYNMVLGARYLVVSNGMRHYCCHMPGDGSYHFVGDLPSASDLYNAL